MNPALFNLGPPDAAVRLLCAAVLGGIIGFERERVDQPAGLRDHALVALGSALIVIVSAYGFDDVTSRTHVILDPSRMAAQVVSGIGFIGAGTIIVRRRAIRGLTTASSIWVAASVGLAAGGALYFAAVVSTFAALIILAGLKTIERRMNARRRRRSLEIVMQGAAALAEVIAAIESHGAQLERVGLDRDEKGLTNAQLFLGAPSPSAQQLAAIVETLGTIPAVRRVRTPIVGSIPATETKVKT